MTEDHQRALLSAKARFDAPPDLVSVLPTVGGGQISGAYRRRTGGPGSYPESSGFLKRKAHLIVVAFIGGGLAGARASGPASYFRNRSCLKGRLFCPETARYYHRLLAAT